MRLTERQVAALSRIKKSGTEAISPDVARQLILKGLARHVRDYQRKEWNQVVSTLWVCELTEAGRKVAEGLAAPRI